MKRIKIENDILEAANYCVNNGHLEKWTAIASYEAQLLRISQIELGSYYMQTKNHAEWLTKKLISETAKDIEVKIAANMVALYQYKLALDEIRDNHKPLKQIKK